MKESRFPGPRLAAAALLFAVALTAVPALAASTPPSTEPVNHLYDKFQLDMSVADVPIGPKIKVDNADGSSGSEIESGDILGLNRSGAESRISMRWRPGHRHELEAGFMLVHRNGNKRLTKDFTFRDSTFKAGANISSSFGGSDAFLAYRFAFMAKKKTQLGAQLGFGAIFFKASIFAFAGVANGNDTLTTSYGASGSFPGPTAALGLYGRFRFGEKWYLEANGGGVGATIQNITVTTYEGSADLRYFINEKFGLEAGYGITTVKISVDKEGSGGIFDPNIQGDFRYPFQNIRMGVVAAFQ
jgi:hypothetical protein